MTIPDRPYASLAEVTGVFLFSSLGCQTSETCQVKMLSWATAYHDHSATILSLKRKGDYAVRAIISVGRHYGTGLRQAHQISTEMHIPYKTLTLILARLAAEGLLIATHGPNGGYRLARHPSDISVLDIVEAAEEPATLDHCVLRDGPCDWEETCPVHDTWTRAQEALTRELASTSLAELAAIDAAIEAGSYQPEAPPHTRPTDRHGNRN